MMRSIANDYHHTSSAASLGGGSKPFLVAPSEILFVIPDEAVLVVGYSISGVAVDNIAAPSAVHNLLKICGGNNSPLQCFAGPQDKVAFPEGSWCSFPAPKRHIENAKPIDSVHASVRCSI